MKKIIIGAVIVIAAAVGGYFIYRSRQPHYVFATATQGGIVQQVLATGNVQSPTTINLSFQNSGKLTALNVSTGDSVRAGDVLAREDASVLQAELVQGQANVAAQQAKLDLLQTGATTQTIAVSQTALATAQQALANSYTGIPNAVNDAYTKANDAVRNQLAAFFSEPEQSNPQLTFLVSDSNLQNTIQSTRVAASTELNGWQAQLASTTATAGNTALDAALQDAADHLSVVQNLMQLSNTALTDEIGLSASSLAAYKVSATAGTTEVNAAIAEISAAQQMIATEETAIAQAQAGLNLTTASSTPQDVQAQQALVAQAQASVAATQAQIAQTVLSAPVAGTITQTTGDVGETVSPSDVVVSLIPESALEIKANISEDDIANVQVGQTTTITLDAFGDNTQWTGNVVEIDPAQTTIGGAIYYQATILFDQADSRIKPGMTANVWIETGSASSTLIVPASAIETDGTSTEVQIVENGKVTTQSVTTGLEDQNGMVQIVSGLSAGDQVITGTQ